VSSSRQIDGLWISSWDDGDAAKADLDRVEEALRVIKTHDPQRYGRLLLDLERIWVRLVVEGVACFESSIWACVIDPRHLRDEGSSPERIAATIVHEATHARLWRCGIGYPEALRASVEAVCFRRERAFAAKLPNGEQIRDQAERKLEAYADQDYWTDAAFRTRYEAQLVTSSQYMGMPAWLIRICRPIRSLLLGLRRARGSLAGSANPRYDEEW
jgi:hypothetical protein